MIASIMFIGLGFLVAALGTLVVIPLVHDRAVRLTTRRLEAALPQSIAQIHAGKDQLRAQFAVSTRSLEIKIDRLKDKAAGYFAEIAAKNDVIYKLETERNAQQAEISSLKGQVEALAVRGNEVIDELKNRAENYFVELGHKLIVIDKLEIERDALQARNFALTAQVEALTVGGNQVRAESGVGAEVPQVRPNAEVAMVPADVMVPADSVYGLTPSAHDREGVAVSFVPNVWPLAELFRVPRESRPANDRRRRGDIVPPVPAASLSAETAADVPIDASRPPPPDDQGRGGSIASLVPGPEPTAEPVKAPNDAAHSPPLIDRQLRSDTVSPVPGKSPATETTADVPIDAVQPPPPDDQRREGSIAGLAPGSEPTAEPVKTSADGAHGLPLIDRQLRSDAVSRFLMRLKADETRSGGLGREPDAMRASPDRHIGVAGERSGFPAGSEPIVPSIRVSPKDGFGGRKRSTAGPVLARIAAAVPIVAGVSIAWHYYGEEATETMETIKTRIPSLDRLSAVLTTKLSPYFELAARQSQVAHVGQESAQYAASQPLSQTAPAPAAAATSPELVQRELQAVMHDLAALRHGVEQLTAEQEQMSGNIATRQVAAPPIKHTVSFPRQQRRANPTPMPETRPTTISGWTLLEVTGDSVVLKGPNGIWRATRGDEVPGVGIVESVVRWGNRWIVATSRGLVSTP